MITILEKSISDFINQDTINNHKNHCGPENLLDNEFIFKGISNKKIKFVYTDRLRESADKVQVIKLFKPEKYDDLNTIYKLETMEIKAL